MADKSKIRIDDLERSNVEDLICVCSGKRLNDPVHQQGIELKRQWLFEMLDTYGSCAKIAYYDDKPVAQILFYPAKADKSKALTQENVLVIGCVYNPTPEAQKLGIATKLLQSLIQDAKQRKTCLGSKPCRFILTKAFNTGELLSLPDFYRKSGFLPTPEENLLYLPMEGDYEHTEATNEYKPLPEDRDKAVILYSPACQFAFQFAKNMEKIIREVSPDIEVHLINEWREPQESLKRKNWPLVVNAKAIRTFFMNTDKFKEEVRQAME